MPTWLLIVLLSVWAIIYSLMLWNIHINKKISKKWEELENETWEKYFLLVQDYAFLCHTVEKVSGVLQEEEGEDTPTRAELAQHLVNALEGLPWEKEADHD